MPYHGRSHRVNPVALQAMNVRISPEVKRSLDHLADSLGISLAQLVESVCAEHLKKNDAFLKKYAEK